MQIAETENNDRFWAFPRESILPVPAASFSIPVHDKESGSPKDTQENKGKGRGVILRIEHPKDTKVDLDDGAILVIHLEGSYLQPEFEVGEEVFLSPVDLKASKKKEESDSEKVTLSQEAPAEEESNPDFVLHLKHSRPR